MDTLQLEWLNQNALRSYPIREDCGRIPHDSAGNLLSSELAIPNSLIVDFVFSIPSEASPNVYVKKLSFVGDFINLSFGSGDNVIGTVAIDLTSHVPNQAYPFIGQGDYEAAVGTVVLGDLSSLSRDFPEGQYNYTADQTVFEATCVRPSARGVTSLSIVDGTSGYIQKRLYGDVKLVSGSNIEFKYDAVRNAVIINAGDGLGFTEECDCGGIADRIIRYINGVSASAVQIAGDECVSVTTSDGVITISDTCSKPCCGCNELAFINDKISEIQTAISKIEHLVQECQAHQTAFDAVVALDTALGGSSNVIK